VVPPLPFPRPCSLIVGTGGFILRVLPAETLLFVNGSVCIWAGKKKKKDGVPFLSVGGGLFAKGRTVGTMADDSLSLWVTKPERGG